MPRVLFVYTSANKNLLGKPTGWYLPEAAHPYYILAPHVEIDFAAPAGSNPPPPVDPGSVEQFKDNESVKFLQDPTVKTKFSNTKKLSDVKVEDYDAIFYIGGHGPVLDLATDPENIKLANSFWAAGKITSAVCHGPAALVGVTDTNGKSIFEGRRATGFSNEEERQAKAVETIPFLLQDKITSLGGKYQETDPWTPQVVVDGKLITGQNPASAGPIGEALLKALRS